MTDSQNPSATAGAMLRAAREKQGLHIAALAAAIKVSPRKLDALENDRWQELPDATFARALAQTVCRTLKIDARPVLDKLPAPTPFALERQDSGLNEPFRERPGREEPSLAASAIKPMVWAAALLMVAAMLIYFLPTGLFSRLTRPEVAASSAVSLPAVVAAPAAASAAVSVKPAASSAAADGPGMVASVDGPASAPSGETVFSAPPAAAAASGAEAQTASRLLQLRTTEASWVEVRDAKGVLLLSRTVLPSESVGLDGQLPLRLTIGNALATQLQFRGQAVDLSTRTRDNVARVELQ